MAGVEDLAQRMWLLSFVGWAITILMIKSFVSFSKDDYHLGFIWLVCGVGLAVIFFRNRILLLAVLGLTFICVNAGLTALFHPSGLSVSLTVGSVVGMYVLAKWSAKKFPNLTSRDWKTLFDADPKS
jgi:hypothetical protein